MLLGTNCQPFFVAHAAPQGHLVRQESRVDPTQPLSAAQRYNTLDFVTKVVCQQGMLLAPIGNPEPKRGYPSLKSPRPFRIPDQASNTQSPQHRSMYFSGAILCEREIQIAHISTHSCSKVRCCCRSETRVYLRSQKCWNIRPKAPDARRMSAALLGGMQANATQQMGLFGRIEQRWGVFRYTLNKTRTHPRQERGVRVSLF